MFSYISAKGSQTTLQNNLIEEIQSIANDIFDLQPSSVTRTQNQLQEITLQYSSDQDHRDNLIFKDHEKEIRHHENDIRHHENDIFPHPNHDSSLLEYSISAITRSVRQTSQKQPNSDQSYEPSLRRLTKSMVSGHLLNKEPGAFSNNYYQPKNISASSISPVPKKPETQNENDLSLSALNPTNPNKENMLMGILSSVSKPKPASKTPNKKGKFSNSYASNYLSPYSTKGIKQNPKSYMQKSNNQINYCARKQKQTLELQYIKQRLNQNIEPQISYRKQKQELNRLKNPKLSNIKSKYKETKPIMQDYKLYADQHIYKKMKNQMGVWEEKKKYYQTLSNDQIEYNWQEFIEKQKRFLQEKKKSILTKQIQNVNRESSQFSHSPSKIVLLNGKNTMHEVTAPKMTPEDYINKYKREKEKLKEKLEANQITNFVSKSYENMKMFGKQIFDSVWGSTVSKQSRMQSLDASNMSGQYSTTQQNSNSKVDPVAKLLIDSDPPSNKKTHENFFISVGGESYKSLKKKPREGNSSHKKNKNASRSSLRKKSKSGGKSNSREPKSANRKSNSAKKREGISSLSPFIKKQSYFTAKDLPPEVYAFDARQHNSPLFNEQLRTGKSKSKNKSSQKKSNQKISELLNPKYFKSINELQEYASTSRQKSDNMRKTFDSKANSKEDENSLEFEGKQMTFKNLKRSPERRNTSNYASGFDSKLMTKIISDLDQMRNEIQENKKKRQYRIQNYRNFSNIRKSERSYEEQSSPHKMMKKRRSHRFKEYQATQQSEQQSFQKGKNANRIFGSRSVSPIEREDSIMMSGNNLSVSMIEPHHESKVESGIKNLQLSQFNSRMINSSTIMVKSRDEVDFIFKE